MTESSTVPAEPKRSMTSWLRIGAAVGTVAVTVGALCATTFAGRAPLRVGGLGPQIAMSSCPESHATPGQGFVIYANHEPGETHRYEWILSIDGKDVLGGTADLFDNGSNGQFGESYVVPHSYYPVQVGGTYRLRVADRDAQPDRINKVSVTMTDCTGIRSPTTIIG